MEKEWIPIIGTLLGVLFGGGIAFFAKKTELNHQAKQENRNQLLSKFEQLHQAVYEYPSLIANYGNSITDLVYQKQLKKNDFSLVAYEESKNLHANSITRIGGMLKIYAPEYYSEFEDILSATSKMVQLSATYLETEEQSEFVNLQGIVFKKSISLQRKIENKIQRNFFNSKNSQDLLRPVE